MQNLRIAIEEQMSLAGRATGRALLPEVAGARKSIERFARVLHRDLDAVYSAIELPWSNAQAEGQINRLKTVERAMYGRAGPELRARMLPIDQNRHHTK